MEPQILHAATTIIIIFILIAASLTSCEEQYDDDDDDDDNKRSAVSCSGSIFTCGEHVYNISYPFWAANTSQEYCCLVPGFELKCRDYINHPTIDISNQTYRLLAINTSNRSLRIARNDLWEDVCPDQHRYYYYYVNDSPFMYISSPDHQESVNLFFYASCPYYINTSAAAAARNRFVCNNISGAERVGDVYYANESSSSFSSHDLQHCQFNITVPVLEMALEQCRNNESMTLLEVIQEGFNVEYSSSLDQTCENSGGSCWSGGGPDTTKGDGLNLGRKLAIGFGAAAFGAIFMCIIFFVYQRSRLKKRYSSTSSSYMVSRDIRSNPTTSSVADLESAATYLGVHVFNYHELEEATNNFDPAKELGDGGFGTVYKGKLGDGRVVAIKRLYENNYKRVEQFMNEIEILTHLRHQNLVTLYGCTSYRCRELLLVYEYIPNGTVADHLHGEISRPGSPPWTTRLNIAVETASALAYLHASNVIHRDVKTNNILLDHNFRVKVADFGLSRSKPTDVTHVSTAPQGTPGYVDPEYHQYYHLTDKSDVYSFGVVLIELISSKPAVDITRHRHEINLSNMAISKIQNHALHELVDPHLGFEADDHVRTMMTAVAELGFRCLQLVREMRPCMKEVLEVLQGIQSNGITPTKEAEEMDIPSDDVRAIVEE